MELFQCSATDTTIVNTTGGKQSKLAFHPGLLPVEAVIRVCNILTVGAKKYRENNWRLISQKEHLDHAMQHLLLFNNGDNSEDHLGNAACRILFACSETIDKVRPSKRKRFLKKYNIEDMYVNS
jgi:hypothetical protein